MRRLKFLLRPGWLSLILVIVAFAVVCFTVLSPWQFRRNEQREAQNQAISRSQSNPPRPLPEVLPGNAPPGPDQQWRKITTHGHYLPQGETLARLRTVQGDPAFEVLTPFRADNGQVLLIDRGFVRPVHGTGVPAYPAPPGGDVALQARVQDNEQDAKRRTAFQAGGHRQVYAINAATVGQATGLSMRPGYFQLTAGQPGVLNPIPLPQLDSGPFFSYALQWIVFGVMAPFGVFYLIYRELNPIEEREETLNTSVAAALAEDDAEADEAERRRATSR